MLALITAAGERVPEVEQLLGNALERRGHTWIAAGPEHEAAHEIRIAYVLVVAGTSTSRYGRTMSIVADWSELSDLAGQIFAGEVPLHDPGHNVSRGFVDRVGEEDLAEIAAQLADAIDSSLDMSPLSTSADLAAVIAAAEALHLFLQRVLVDRDLLEARLEAAYRELAGLEHARRLAQAAVETLEHLNESLLSQIRDAGKLASDEAADPRLASSTQTTLSGIAGAVLGVIAVLSAPFLTAALAADDINELSRAIESNGQVLAESVDVIGESVDAQTSALVGAIEAADSCRSA